MRRIGLAWLWFKRTSLPATLSLFFKTCEILYTQRDWVAWTNVKCQSDWPLLSYPQDCLIKHNTHTICLDSSFGSVSFLTVRQDESAWHSNRGSVLSVLGSTPVQNHYLGSFWPLDELICLYFFPHLSFFAWLIGYHKYSRVVIFLNASFHPAFIN